MPQALQRIVVPAGRLHEDALGQLELEALRPQSEGLERSRNGLLEIERCLELQPRDAQRNQWRCNSCVAPLSELTTDFVHRPAPQRHYQSVRFRSRKEHAGSQIGAPRMMPVHLRFQADDVAGSDLDLRLIQNKELSRRHSPAQFHTQVDARADLVIHRIGKEAVGPATFGLGPIQRLVRVLEHRFRIG